MQKRSSVSIARNRLKALVTSDRVNCSPAAYEDICRELFETLSKYMELTEDNFDVEINRNQVIITFLGEET
ncbi:cell division topological specificity factor MinE [Mordavella massiliensis]|jgi:cell division topological specificity factor|uniref:Cell division topological specificity factor MinE n=1 Tax=Mordavella massiliensis TaxID=1871024 RepID=A0A938X0B5_9CLOT|nr:cell division topological specificity factor MinE [Mordavella massiliensis]MBM6825982.1 cell division topological specificity factor MinE [Mordavella massiliensis]MBM6969508.1 cell division topological specificity factor MinE [Mordavella massiliensis]HJB85937.1 cell division topological specificity factor MinE [Candidatus Dorea faecigallinarum]